MLISLQTKTMEVLGLGAGAALIGVAALLKRSISSPRAVKDIDKKIVLKTALDKTTRIPDSVWGIVREYLVMQYTIDVQNTIKNNHKICFNRDPLAISMVEFSSLEPDDPINKERFYRFDADDPLIKHSQGIAWAKILHTKHAEDQKNCYLSWAITDKGPECLDNVCSAGQYFLYCSCGGCFPSSFQVCPGMTRNWNECTMRWKPCERPEAKTKLANGKMCHATVGDHTVERGGTKLSIIICDDAYDKEISDVLKLRVPE